MTFSVAGSILVTVPLGPLETQIEPKPASTSRGVDCLICATSLPTGTGPETLVEDWPQELTDMNAMMVRTAFNCRQPTPEHYSVSSPCAATRIRWLSGKGFKQADQSGCQIRSHRQIWLLHVRRRFEFTDRSGCGGRMHQVEARKRPASFSTPA